MDPIQNQKKEKDKHSKHTRTSRSSDFGISKRSERLLRFPADHRSETVPVHIDQNAKKRIAANAQNLYRPLPNNVASCNDLDGIEFVFNDEYAVVGVDTGINSSSFICRF